LNQFHCNGLTPVATSFIGDYSIADAALVSRFSSTAFSTAAPAPAY
jgi:hypothetical protein